ncbi:thiol-disulfide oxidoreductase DCC family protein [Streptomyces sp. NPDC002908]|uniref:thiol-disulfide oxidoreductase DCC family protein n=1 Tax=Streptomyces sp. NPDC002908 TaxID=3364670 RepID=UPI0036C5BA7E
MPQRSVLSVLVYDGDCAFCTTSVTYLMRRLRPKCTAAPWQFTDLDTLGVTRRRAQHELLYISPAGTVYGGAQAVAKILLRAGGIWAWPGGALTLPPARWIAHGIYRVIAAHRDRLPGGSPACAVPTGHLPGQPAAPGRPPVPVSGRRSSR